MRGAVLGGSPVQECDVPQQAEPFVDHRNQGPRLGEGCRVAASPRGIVPPRPAFAGTARGRHEPVRQPSGAMLRPVAVETVLFSDSLERLRLFPPSRQ